MRLVHSADELRNALTHHRQASHSVALVPTMGALHDGHASLIRQAARDGGVVAVSIFVNPTQFGPTEDFHRYPRDLDADLTIASQAGADLVWAPTVEEIYPTGFSTEVTVRNLTSGLCGRSRPTHFAGVTTVVARLFGLSRPDRAYFGEKDFQQLQVIRRMTEDLALGVRIVPCPTVREPDGLALSSRNRYLSIEDRVVALALPRALQVIADGAEPLWDLRARGLQVLTADPRLELDYLEIVNPDTLVSLEEVRPGHDARVLGAVRVGGVRLIDNMPLRRL